MFKVNQHKRTFDTFNAPVTGLSQPTLRVAPLSNGQPIINAAASPAGSCAMSAVAASTASNSTTTSSSDAFFSPVAKRYKNTLPQTSMLQQLASMGHQHHQSPSVFNSATPPPTTSSNQGGHFSPAGVLRSNNNNASATTVFGSPAQISRSAAATSPFVNSSSNGFGFQSIATNPQPAPTPSDDSLMSEVYFDRDPTPMAQSRSSSASAYFHASPSNVDELVLQALPPSFRKRKGPAPQDQQYSWDDMCKIVSTVLHDRENQIRQEYENTLNDVMREQFESFTKFNHDYIHRQINRSDASYLS